ncbi:hypothetical protein R3P38DRAFT_3225587 [Favolaschia claudopus]|uniref:Uncharacterized protein n=1 Tax=Favolaschia claudopus TaxID=2862362 RepID=A0AAV9ZUH4_9AGAR
MTRAGAAARKREREGLGPVKPGPPGWVQGSKVGFFAQYADEYRAAAEIKRPGPFYEKVAHRYLAKYGYNTPWLGDLEEGQTIADDVDEDEDEEALPTEEAKTRAKYFRTLKGKIGAHYNGKYGGSVGGKKKATTSFKTVFDKPELAPPAPVKPRILWFYSHRFYNERVKDHVTARWAAVSRLPDAPKEITVRNAVTKECWERESESFKAEVREALEKEYEAAKAAHAIATAAEAPKTAEEYNVALNNAGYYLQPFADAVHERFGMNVAILLCGPIADRGGSIEVRSIHSGTTKGLVPRIWSDYDRGGFDAAQRSFVAFTHECFTDEECRARSLGNVGNDAESEPSAGTSAEGTQGVAPSAGPAQESSAAASSGDAHAPDAPPLPTTEPPTSPPALPPPPSAIAPHATAESSSSADMEWANSDLFSQEALDALNRYWAEREGLGVPSDQMMPSDFGMGDVGMGDGLDIGRALKAELAALSEEEYMEQMGLLYGMSASELKEANGMARDRLLLARLSRGVPASVALDMSSDPEDDGEDEDGDGAAAGTTPETNAVSGDEGGAGKDMEERDERQPTPPIPLTLPIPPTLETTWWEVQEMGSWTTELVSAFQGFSRGRTWGGEGWQRCISLLLEFERKNGFQDKGGAKAPSGKEERPAEVAKWMQLRREWGSPYALNTEIGGRDVEGSFANRWWVWWEAGQPAARLSGGAWASARDVREEDWAEMRQRYGRNGLLLYVGGLLWWGEAAAKEEEEREELLREWEVAVQDVCDVLGQVVNIVGESAEPNAQESGGLKTGAPQTRSRKRVVRDASSERDKENARPKRQRTKA